MKPLARNTRRARRIDHVLNWSGGGDDPAEGLTDLLADARHFCDRHGLSFAELDRVAYQHYLAELTNTQGD